MVVRGVTERARSAPMTAAVAATMAAGLTLLATPVAPSPAAAASRPVVELAGAPVQSSDRVQRALQAPPKPTAVQISGKFPEGKITVRPEDGAEIFQNLLSQVAWLADIAPQTGAPKADKLGPKFTILVLAQDAPQQTYDVYPLAAGGPRAFRPEKQPGGRKTEEGWFYGRLNMSESLRLCGIPLEEKLDAVTGGVGGGERTSLDEKLNPAGGVSQFLEQLRTLILLNGAVALTIALGLAGMAYLIRRKV